MLDYLGIFKEFNAKKIKYIVVGGLAVNLLGVPRITYDIDLLLYFEDKNLQKFLTLMKRWGFKPKVPVDIMEFLDEKKREDWIKNKNMKAFRLYKPQWPISEIDILIDTPVDYNEAIKNIHYIKSANISIPVISIDDLIKMKSKTGRKQDKADIRYLKKIKNEKNRWI
ncbi:MAG: hypothetical protein NC900_00935 [Candidatus Omnitrophica bacterium]|nr:hypothetical protein [Candidatus Omnitrophota bacterium]